MKGRLWSFLPLAVFAALTAVAFFVLMQGGARRDMDRVGLIGQPLPAFELARLEGGAPLTNADFAGKPFLVNIWFHDCAGCRVEHPLLLELKAKGAPILGVAWRDTPEEAQGFLTELGDPFTAVGLDPEGAFAVRIGMMGAPETFVVDGQGQIRAVIRGALTPEKIEAEIAPVLGLN